MTGPLRLERGAYCNSRDGTGTIRPADSQEKRERGSSFSLLLCKPISDQRRARIWLSRRDKPLGSFSRFATPHSRLPSRFPAPACAVISSTT